MKLNKLILIGDAVEQIAFLMAADPVILIDTLTGVAWNEEDAEQIKSYVTEE